MKRFVVFAGDDYHPSGGWDDWHSSHATKKRAIEVANAARNIYGLTDWAHVVDLELLSIVWERR